MSGEEEVSIYRYIGATDVALFFGFVFIVGCCAFRRNKRARKDTKSYFKSNPVIGTPALMEPDSIVTGMSFVEKMRTQNKKVIVFYGSQTGTAEGFAMRLAKDARRYGLPSMVYDPDCCGDWEILKDVGKIEGSLAIFCMASYGEGDCTDNSAELAYWLKEQSPDLKGLRYTVFALGNKTYEFYNRFGCTVDKRLAECGATRAFEHGEGNADDNIEEDFVTWKEKLWPGICEYFKLDITTPGSAGRDYGLVVYNDLLEEEVFVGEPYSLQSYKKQERPFNVKNPFLAPMRVKRELHKAGDRSCMHIELDITGSGLRYVAGDHVAIYPENDGKMVERIGELLQADLDQVFTLVNKDEQAAKKHPFPCPTTYRHALLYYVDITSLVRTNVLQELAEYCTSEEDKQHLVKLTSPTEEAKQAYAEWIVKDQRNILSVLEELPSLKPPIDHLLELLPRLQVRYYSISSSQKMHANSVHITAVLADYQTRTGRNVKGVATGWFNSMTPSTGDDAPLIPIYMRKSSLRLPRQPFNPVIMIGPGTGIAPYKGFIEDRCVTKQQGKPLGDSVLFFGCRHRSQDYIYEEELSQYLQDGVLSKLFVAFSRDQAEKIYVHHNMTENADLIWHLLEDKNAYLYICGDARNMARDVLATLTLILKTQGRMNDAAASQYIRKLQKSSRFLQDVWS